MNLGMVRRKGWWGRGGGVMCIMNDEVFEMNYPFLFSLSGQGY